MERDKTLEQIQEVGPKHECNSYCFPDSGINPELSLLQRDTSEMVKNMKSKKSD